MSDLVPGSSIAAVSFRDVSKRFKGSRGAVQALDGVTFDIFPGEFFGLLGPNGAGKTTLINIPGLAQASAGRVLVHGHDVVADYAAARRSLGIVPQELVFDPFFTVRETLQIQSGYFGVRTDRVPMTPGSTNCSYQRPSRRMASVPTCVSCPAA